MVISSWKVQGVGSEKIPSSTGQAGADITAKPDVLLRAILRRNVAISSCKLLGANCNHIGQAAGVQTRFEKL